MRIRVLYAHPVKASFVAALRKQVIESLGPRGHEVDDCDLNVEGFDPVMTRHDLIDDNNMVLDRMRVAPVRESQNGVAAARSVFRRGVRTPIGAESSCKPLRLFIKYFTLGGTKWRRFTAWPIRSGVHRASKANRRC